MLSHPHCLPSHARHSEVTVEGKTRQALRESAAWSWERCCSQRSMHDGVAAKTLEGNQNGEMHDTPKERCLYSRGCYLTRVLKAESKPARDRELREKPRCIVQASLVVQRIKRLPAMQETWVQSLGWEDPLEKEMATHSSILAWRISWTEEPGRLQYTGSQRVRHD